MSTLEDYLNHDEMCVSVVRKKYLEYPEQPIEEFYANVVNNICDNSVENTQPDKRTFVSDCIDDWYKGIWKGAGSILAAGPNRDKKISVFNCTGLKIHEDSIDAIADTRKFAAKMAAHRQGLGVEFSNLRPRGAKINNSAVVSEGAVHWMKSFDTLASEVGQRGRLPAMLFALDINHPDIEEFITCKDDVNNINNANISVFLDDNFMQEVVANTTHRMVFTTGEGEIIEKEMPARKLFAMICKQAWKNGEPGIIFRENMKNGSIQEALGESIVVTNACVTGDTPILTDKGYVPISSVVDTHTVIWNGYDWSEVTPKVTGTNQEIYRVELDDGSSLDCTGYHKFVLKDGKRVECKDLVEGMQIIKCEYPIIQGHITAPSKRMYTQGFYTGDGRSARTQVFLYEDKMNLVEHLDHNTVSDISTDRQNRIYVHVNLIKHDKKFIPSVEYTVQERLNWLAGLMDSDGTVTPDGMVQIGSIDKKFLCDVRMLLHTLGVNAQVKLMRRAGTRLLPDTNGKPKEYNTKDSYRLCISLWAIAELKRIGLKTHRLDLSRQCKRSIKRNAKIVSVIKTDTIADKVYCFNEPINHTGLFNGIITGQCAEKPLPDQSVCCLAPLNMEFVPNPFTQTVEFHDFMKRIVPRMVRFMDDVVQYEIDLAYKSPTEKQASMVRKLREIGLGILNLHKWFYNNNVAYGSLESIRLTDEFFKWYIFYAFSASVELAKQRGPCEAWSSMKSRGKLEELMTPFLHNLFTAFPQLKDEYLNTGIRNAALLSVAPTGTVSMTFPNMLSTGIEPLIGYAYWRRTRALSSNQSYDNFFVLPHTVKTMLLEKIPAECQEDLELIQNTPTSQLDQDGEIGKKIIAVLNKHIDTSLLQPSHLVDPFAKIQLMSAAQKWIDASISVTYNVPFTFTEEETQELYRAAWTNKLKSITIYRDGSREGIYIFEDPITHAKKIAALYRTEEASDIRPTDIQYHRAPKRPEELPCEMHHTSIKGEQWLVLVGLLNRHPYEVFAGKKNEDFNISKNIQSGTIIKNNKGVYTLRITTAASYIDYHNIADLFMNVEYKALTRLISLSLRHGVYSEFILEQLKKSSEFVSDFMAVISRVLTKYSGNIPKAIGKTCPQCGASIIRVEGCEKCSANCGYSRCE